MGDTHLAISTVMQGDEEVMHVEYDGGDISTISFGALTVELMWEDGEVVGFEDPDTVGSVFYRDGLLSKVSRKDRRGNAARLVTSYTWTDDRLSSIDVKREATSSGGTVDVSETDFFYNEDQRLELVFNLNSLDEHRYWTDGDLRSIHQFRTERGVDFHPSDGQGRLTKVSLNGTDEMTFSYDQGRMIRAALPNDNVYEVFYQEGQATSLNIEPIFAPKAAYIDFSGATRPKPDPRSLLLILGLTDERFF